MPLWAFTVGPGTLTQEEKESLASSITKLYMKFGLPAFYVEVIFKEVEPRNFFIGGERRDNFASISIQHVARSMDTEEQQKRFLGAADAIMNPMFEPKGMDWEYFVSESPRSLWKINGLVPPASHSAEEKAWFENNRPFDYKTAKI